MDYNNLFDSSAVQVEKIIKNKHKDNHKQLNRNQKTFLVVGREVLRSNQRTLSGRHLWQPYECPY